MTTLLTTQPVFVMSGMALLHFIWQGAAVAAILAVLLRISRRRSAQMRYLLCGTGLLLMLACLPLTAWWVHGGAGARPGLIASVIPPSLPSHRSESQSSLMIRSTPAPDQTEAAESAVAEAAKPPLAADDHETAAPAVERLASEGTQGYWSGVLHRVRTDKAFRSQCLGGAAVLWMLCVAFLSLRLVAGAWTLLRWRRSGGPLPESAEGVVRRLAERLGLSPGMRVLASEKAPQPMAFGLLRPVVLLPVSALTSCPMDLLEAMIAHELAHIRRHDIWVNVLQRVIETLLFYHPAVWWVSGRMRLERELCCDDLAVKATGRRIEYAEALVAAARQSQLPLPAGLAAAMAAGRTTLSSRIRRVLGVPEPVERRRVWLAGPLTLVVVLSVVLATGHIRAANAVRTAGDPATSQPAMAGSVEAATPARLLTIETDLTGAPDRDDAAVRQRQELLVPTEAAIEFLRFVADLHGRSVASDVRFTSAPGLAGYIVNYKLLVSQARDDLKALGILDDGERPWKVREVIYSTEDSYHCNRVVLCEPFQPRSGKPAGTAFVACILSPNGYQTLPSRLFVLPVEQRKVFLERFYQRQIERPSPALDDRHRAGASFACVTFRDGYPVDHRGIVAGLRSRSGQTGYTVSVDEKPPAAFPIPVQQIRCFSPLAPDGSAGASPGLVPPVSSGLPVRGPPAGNRERTYVLTWRSAALREIVQGFADMVGLPVLGADALGKELSGSATLESTTARTFDDALTALNEVLFERGCWMVRRNDALEIREITEWYRRIEPGRMFASEAAYRASGASGWEPVSVIYTPQTTYTKLLAERVMDAVPANSVRAAASADGARIELCGFAVFINRALELLKQWDVSDTFVPESASDRRPRPGIPGPVTHTPLPDAPASRPAASGRRLQPGDALEIIVHDEGAANPREGGFHKVEVIDAGGQIAVPGCGKLTAAGLTLGELQPRVDAALRSKYLKPTLILKYVGRPQPPGVVVPVRARADGIIHEVKVQPGERVKEG